MLQFMLNDPRGKSEVTREANRMRRDIVRSVGEADRAL
jgi:hypothetical protein